VHQDRVIDYFIAAINGWLKCDYRVTCWPDKRERGSKEIDAYAEASAQPPLAIEHTSIESFFGQRRDSARFVNVLGPLEQDIEGIFDFGLDLAVRVAAIPTGVNWALIRETIKTWLVNNAWGLADGFSRSSVPGVPFELAIAKHRNTPGKVSIGRFAPPKEETQTNLSLAFAGALKHKYRQLAAYRRAGATSVLIIESDDIALTSPATLYGAYIVARQAIPTKELDQIWFACTNESLAESFCHWLCFHGSANLMRQVNDPNAMFGPQYDEYWERVAQTEAPTPASH
jgi:hypothetical protein